MSDIASWLETHGLGKYTELFIENEIDIEVLPELEEADLKDLNVPLGARKKILKAVRGLKVLETTSPEAPSEVVRASSGGEAERRQLSVMFVDLVGSTAMSEGMDAEDYREVLAAYQAAASDAIKAHSGYIARYMGDGLLAYFGYPTAQENDPERAVRAGLDLVQAVRALEGGLAVRVGIATGPVVVGDIIGEGASEEAAVLGETPNLAARLQSAAIPNTVLISAETQLLLRGRVETEALEPLTLKGLSRLVVPHRALRPRSLSDVSEARLDSTPLIGRDVEMALLQRGWQHALSSEGQAVLLSGEPGVGKSRLLRAFQDGLDKTEHTRVKWHCSPYYQTTASYPAIEQLKSAIGLDGQSEPQSLEALERLVYDLGLAVEALVPSLALLLSVPLDQRYAAPNWSPEELKRRLTQAQLTLLLAAAKQAPVLFIVEDLHWADPTTLDVLREMIAAIRDERVFILMTARPEFTAPWSDQGHATTQRLSSLSRKEAVDLVRGITEKHALSTDVIAQIVERTDGVPLFVEELTRSMLESKGEVGVPTSLQDLLMARLDRLGSVKKLAQVASVIGRVFTLPALVSLVESTPTAVEQEFAELVDSGLVHRGTEGMYEFKHALIRDAAYESMLRATRRDQHGHYVEYLKASGVADKQPELVAQHCGHAEMYEQAVDLWTDAGTRSLVRAAATESAANFRSALEALSHLPENSARIRTEIDISLQLGRALQVSEGWGHEGSREVFEHAVALCEQLDDSGRKAAALRGLWHVLHNLAPAKALTIGTELKSLTMRSSDLEAQMNAHSSLASSNFLLGRFAQSMNESLAGLSVYAQAPEPTKLGSLVSHPGVDLQRYLGLSCDALGLREGAVDAMSRARQVAEATDNPFVMCNVLIWTAMLMIRQRRFTEALTTADFALELSSKHHFPHWGHAARILKGFALAESGSTRDGLTLVRDGIAKWRSPVHLTEWNTHLAAACIRADRLDEARTALTNALDAITSIGAVQYAAECHRLHGALAMLEGSPEGRAENAYQSALSIARKQDARTFELHAGTDLARMWRDRGDTERAQQLLAPIYAGFTEGFDTPALIDAKEVLETLC